MRQLTLVVNCTDRKSVRPHPLLQVRSLAAGDGDSRFIEWADRLSTVPADVELRTLYQGEAWVQATGLARDAATAGFDVTLLVASAGLGLRSCATRAAAYSATFASGQDDTVAAGSSGIRDWWHRLEALPASLKLTDVAGKRTLLVLSENYARALETDLEALGRRGGDLLLVGGARDIAGIPRLASDRALRAHLGGTASSVSLRMARSWLALRESNELYCAADDERWQSWASAVRVEERYDRMPLRDNEVTELIEELLTHDPTLSATRALRRLRDAGVACEQKRFGRLFKAVRGGAA
ncbi:hypothetical protein ACFWPA_08570 [Rhodococcus sp. NPDC058505]|uniref:hypothetical protein n=1 Tax=unclassified Rhodococcus (in: high G+C Gram-positive bacteria) TaxID=192944 RepID=UPI003662EB18